MSFEEAQRRGFILDGSSTDRDAATDPSLDSLVKTPVDTEEFPELDESEQENAAALDDFWEVAVNAELTSSSDRDGLSLEQALQQGLIPKDFQEIPDIKSKASEEAEGGVDPVTKEELPDRHAAAIARGENPAALDSFEAGDGNNIDGKVDLDAFWDSAVDAAGAVGDELTNGLSYEEAVRRGIIKTQNETDETAE